MKNKKGISLIVLVITIIVLAILAATVVIAIVNTGVINSAKDAVEAQKLGQVRDIATVAWGQALINPNVSTPTEYLNHIIDFLKGEGYTDEELDKYTIVANVNGVTVNLKGTNTDNPDVEPDVTPDNPEPVLPENSLVAMYKAGTLKQGDYVDYNPLSGGTYSLSRDTDGAVTSTGSYLSQEKLNWRVLGYDRENDELLLISGSPTIAGILFLYQNVLAYNNSLSILNDACELLYSNSNLGAVARSINANDMDIYLGGNTYDKTTYGNEVDATGKVTQIKSGGYGYINNNISSHYYIDEDSGNIGTGDTEENFTSPSTSYGFDFKDITTDETILEIVGGPNKDYSYWLASRNIEVTSSNVYFCLMYIFSTVMENEGATRLISLYTDSGVAEFGNGPHIRPIVAIPSDVTVEQVPIIEDSPTETWSSPYADGGLDE